MINTSYILDRLIPSISLILIVILLYLLKNK